MDNPYKLFGKPIVQFQIEAAVWEEGRKVGMKEVAEKVDDRIVSLKSLSGVFQDGHAREIERGIGELEWVRRMMKDDTN